MAIHVYPVNDWIEHVVDGWPESHCPCEPEVRWVDEITGEYLPEPLIVHNAIDQRK